MSELKRTDTSAVNRFFSPADSAPLAVNGHSGAEHQSLRIERTADREVIEASKHTVFTPAPVAHSAPATGASSTDLKPVIWLCGSVAFVVLALGATAIAVYAQHLESAAYQKAAALTQQNRQLEALTQSQQKRIQQAQRALCLP